MKHIFKKLHHPNRSNETPQPPQSSDIRPTSSSTPPTTSAASATSNATDDTNRQQQQQQQQEYFASEEEYQVQLALALSVSSSGQGSTLLDPDKTPIHPNVAEENSNLSFDILSRRYWNYGVLDFEERVVDGFYDIYNISADPKVRGNMPSLRDIESDNGISDYEVVIVNRNIDPALQELMQIAHTIVLDYPTTNIPLLIQKLAELVTDHLGGPVRDANLMLVKWMEKSTELRKSLHRSVLPIGSLRTGLSRHRALLFKVLADSVGIPCRLLRGNHYTGIEDDAVNIIKLQNDSECLVDLMGAPGTLIPADALGAQYKSSDPKPNKFPSIPTTKDPKISTDNTNDEVGTSGQNGTVPSANQLDQNLPQAIGSSIGVRKNLNVVPYNQKRAEDPKNLFADLNPFHVKGPVKTLPQNNFSNEVDKFQFPKVNNLSNRPPVPLMWKNREAWNAVSWKNGSDIVDGAYMKDNKGTASKLPEKSFNNQGDKGERPPLGKNYKLPTGEDVSSKLSADRDFSISNKDRDSTIDSKLNMQEIVGTDMKLRVTEGASCSHGSGSSYVNAVIDDVGEREILWEDLIIGERIGLGSYGEVYRADWNGTEVAVKKFLDQDFSGAALDEFKREVRIMRRLRHQNVVLFMGAVTRPPHLSIVTEFLPLGSLYRIIHHPQCQLDEQRRIKMALDVAKGMNCLHTSIPTIVHRDLKTPNLLVDDNWNVKVCDFGLSRLKHNTFLSSKSTAGTPEWMAPEVLRNEPSNEKCDVYSFGVILWELATLRKPWSDMNPMQVVGAVGFQNLRLEIPREVDPLVATIIKQCWQMGPNLRPSFAQLIVALKPLQRLVIPV